MEGKNRSDLKPIDYPSHLLRKLDRIDRLGFENDPRYFHEIVRFRITFPKEIKEEFEEEAEKKLGVDLEELSEGIEKAGESIVRPKERALVRRKEEQKIGQAVGDRLLDILWDVIHDNNMIPETSGLDSTMSSPGKIIEE